MSWLGFRQFEGWSDGVRLVDYAISLPPLEEQRRIAEILDTIDETIQATERVISKLMDCVREAVLDSAGV